MEQALKGCRVGVYLVHSMMPSARLTQGSFEDIDFILADNFARAAKSNGLNHIIYLGGLIPQIPADKLSAHLRSRLEVERVLASHGIPVITLRAGLVVGAGGSSLNILTKLVQRLFVMLCPSWTQTRCQPIALKDVLTLVTASINLQPDVSASYDIGSKDVLTYIEMMRITARCLGVKRNFIPIPLLTPSLSSLWVCLVTGTSLALVRPLVESLKHNMTARDLEFQERLGLASPQSFEGALQDALATEPLQTQKRSSRTKFIKNRANSIQRIRIGADISIQQVADEYTRWLTIFLRPLVQVVGDKNGKVFFNIYPFGFRFIKIRALILQRSEERSSASRVLFYVVGGVLARLPEGESHAGRFEFRSVPDRPEVVVALLDFAPRLPWLVYKFMQATVHVFIMKAFARHFRRKL
jgi:uncharacterized protein YbjT (DUF2867 family)